MAAAPGDVKNLLLGKMKFWESKDTSFENGPNVRLLYNATLRLRKIDRYHSLLINPHIDCSALSEIGYFASKKSLPCITKYSVNDIHN